MKLFTSLITFLFSLSCFAQQFSFSDITFEVGQEKQLRIYYCRDCDSLNHSGKSMDSLYIFLKNNDQLKVEIGAHTNTIGDREFNFNLTTLRAAALKKYLVKRGINGNRLTAVSYGETQPLYDDRTIERSSMLSLRFKFHRLNKRTVIRIIETNYEGE
ncbi:MAG: OmpA family protein [Bacteroidetes bacterium]|nr:OmpA family protein [Bacteroidota bacterium]